MSGCAFVFRHHEKPRSQCGLSIEDPSSEFCFWHTDVRRDNEPNIGERLHAAISQPDHWLEAADLEGASLSDLDLIGAKLPYANFADSNLQGASLDGSLLERASFLSCNLSNASLIGARLAGAVLNGADARCANLQEIDLSAAHLEGLRLDGAYLKGFKFNEETYSYGLEVGMPGEMVSGEYQTAATIFRELSRHFRQISNHQRAEEFYFLQMTALHLGAINIRSLPVGSRGQRFRGWIVALKRCNALSQWLPWALHRWLWGYGSRPFRVVVWMAAIILLFGLLIFPIVGIELGGKISHNLAQCSAESLVCFVSLGSAIRLPNGLLGEVLCGVEALLGVILSSLFVVALATRYVHRP